MKEFKYFDFKIRGRKTSIEAKLIDYCRQEHGLLLQPMLSQLLVTRFLPLAINPEEK